MATKRKRGVSWEFCVRRKHILAKPLYFNFKDEAEGDEYCERIEKLLDAGIVPDWIKQPTETYATVGDVLRAYQAAVELSASDVPLVNRLTDMVGSEAVSKINYDWAETWIQELIHVKALSPTTIRHYVGALARAFDWAQKKNILINPLRMLPKRYSTKGNPKQDQERDRRLTAAEEKRVRKILAQDPDALVMYTLAQETAMRLREIFTLEVRQVDFRKKTIFLEKTKNGNKRQVPMTTIVATMLRDYIGKKKKPERVFPYWNGDRSRRELDRCSNKLSKMFARYFEDAKVKDFNFHDLRHEATSRFFEKTKMDAVKIMSITGHSSTKQLKRYANLRGSDLARELW